MTMRVNITRPGRYCQSTNQKTRKFEIWLVNLYIRKLENAYKNKPEESRRKELVKTEAEMIFKRYKTNKYTFRQKKIKSSSLKT